MSEMTKAHAANGMTAVAIGTAILLLIWLMRAESALDVAVGEHAYSYWAAVLAWIICTAGSLLWLRRWWLLLTAPIMLYSALPAALIVAACLQGDCL